VAGALIAAFPRQNIGVGIAIAFDAFTFIIPLSPMDDVRRPAGYFLCRGGSKASVWPPSGRLVYMLKDPALRSCSS